MSETNSAKRHLILNPSMYLNLEVHTRAKKQSLKTHYFNKIEQLREIFDLLSEVTKLKPGQRIPNKFNSVLDILEEMGIAIDKRQAPEEVSDHRRIGMRDLKLVPKVFKKQFDEIYQNRKLILNRNYIFLQKDPARPNTKISGLPPSTSFPFENPLCWVFDPQTQMWAFYQFHKVIFNRLRDLIEGSIRVSDLTRSETELFFYGRILNPIGYHRAQESHWGQQINEAQHNYAKLGYAVISGIITPLQISFMRSYQRSKESEGYWGYDDYKSHERFFLHNDPQLRAIHRQTGRLVRSIIQSDLFPSYSFMSAYAEGAQLVRHTDRPQCKWNGSLLLDQRPEVLNEDSWPIYLEVEGKAHEVKLDMGDIVFFSGTDIPHWRNTIEDRHRQTLGLFHYVPIDFTGSLA